MTNKEIWFITGASRGMGVDFTKAALAAGHAVVASGRDRDAVSKALGQSNDLLAVSEWSSHHGEHSNNQMRITVTLTHEEMAQLIGSSRETITRLFSDFEKKPNPGGQRFQSHYPQ